MRLHWVVTIFALGLSMSAENAPGLAGRYVGTGTASRPAVDRKSWAAEVSQEGPRTYARIISLRPGENYFEEWIWDDTTLLVRQHTFIPGNQRPDFQIHQEVSQFTATLNGGRYHIDCRDREANDCAMGLDARCYWTINPTTEGFTCEAWGPLDRSQAGDPIRLCTLVFRNVP